MWLFFGGVGASWGYAFWGVYGLSGLGFGVEDVGLRDAVSEMHGCFC